MKFPYSVIVQSENETAALAAQFISIIDKGDVVVLNGNLGTGKTFFIKKALENFSVHNVNSPTFAIVNEYHSHFKFYHFDFYRINSVRELYDIGINDYLGDTEAVTFIEWGELFREILPSARIEINITMNEDFTRKFEFTKYVY